MKLPNATAESSLMPATQQYMTYSKKSESFLAPQMKAREHSVPKIQYAMNEDEAPEELTWTRAMKKAGIPELYIVANILRWENYESLFSIVQVGGENGAIFAFDSGEGFATGLYSGGKKITKQLWERPQWEYLFGLYGVKVTVERYGLKTKMDGEKRMVKYFESINNKPLIDKSLHIVTAASPCNKTCANLLAGWVKEFNHGEIRLEYISPYIRQEKQAFIDSINTLISAKIEVSPVPLTMIDKSILIYMNDKYKLQDYLASVATINSDLSKYTLEYNPYKAEIERARIPESLSRTT